MPRLNCNSFSEDLFCHSKKYRADEMPQNVALYLGPHRKHLGVTHIQSFCNILIGENQIIMCTRD